MSAYSPTSFEKAALAAFPDTLREMAFAAIDELMPWVDQSYKISPRRIELLGRDVFIAYRFHYAGLDDRAVVDAVSVAAACLLTRSTDGFLRQRALRRIVNVQEPWVAPYVTLLLGEYVVEIAEDILAVMPGFDHDIYVNFVLENRSLLRFLRARATRYWDCYYRTDYPELRDYPAFRALRELESWAG